MQFTALLPKDLERDSELPGEEGKKEVMQVHGKLKMPLLPQRGP